MMAVALSRPKSENQLFAHLLWKPVQDGAMEWNSLNCLKTLIILCPPPLLTYIKLVHTKLLPSPKNTIT